MPGEHPDYTDVDEQTDAPVATMEMSEASELDLIRDEVVEEFLCHLDQISQ
ncbi:MAG: hypothetical protein O3A81_04830 [bacterium]|nr:hypothetical protein [bacterium]